MTIDAAVLKQAGLRLDIDDSSPAGSVATVTLSRPERRNAMTPGMWHGLAAIGDSLPPRVRVVVVRGEGSSLCARKKKSENFNIKKIKILKGDQ